MLAAATKGTVTAPVGFQHKEEIVRNCVDVNISKNACKRRTLATADTPATAWMPTAIIAEINNSKDNSKLRGSQQHQKSTGPTSTP